MAKLLLLFILLLQLAVPCISIHNISSPIVTLDPVVIQGSEIGECPSIQQREDAMSIISSTVRDSILVAQTTLPVPECGEGNWQQVADLNMRDPTQQCPPEWREVSTPVRSCGRHVTRRGSCVSVLYSTIGSQYSRVCGRVTGYAHISPDAFHVPRLASINDIYVDGISVTRGYPRDHIWTFAAGRGGQCPCDTTNRVAAPLPASFVGDNYFCDTDRNGALWDGEDCITDCCTFNSPPWFNVQLPTRSSDDIEVRICAGYGTHDEDSPIELLQLYIQ